MSWYAIDNLDDAITATTDFLTPVDWRTWIKLAVVVFFVGGPGGGFNAGQANVPTSGGREPGGPATGIPPVEDFLAVVEPWMVAIAAAVGVFLLFLQFVGAVMEFVLLAALRDQRVTIRRSWRAHWRAGARLFGFRIALLVIGLAVLGVALATVLLPMLGMGSPLGPVLGAVFLIPLGILVLIVLALVMGFTTQFVAPVMLIEGRSVLGAWRRFWPTLRADWKQYAVYVALSVVLSIAAGILTAIAGLIAVLGLLIPFGILGLVAYGLFVAAELAGVVFGAIVLILFVIALVVVFTLIRAPIVTYLRYYALLVLGDSNDAFDLIPDLRRRVREPAPADE